MLGMVVLLASTGADPGATAVAPAPRPVRPNARMKRPSSYIGEVMAIDKRSITIRGKEEGAVVVDVIRTFAAGDALLKGEQDLQESGNCDYRLQDVKVGDKVYIKIHRGEAEENDTCTTVCIMRRPGGLIPVAPFESPTNPDPYHIVANAWQAFEERASRFRSSTTPNTSAP